MLTARITWHSFFPPTHFGRCILLLKMSDRKSHTFSPYPYSLVFLTHVLPIVGSHPFCLFVGRVILTYGILLLKTRNQRLCTELSDSTTWRFVRSVLANGGGGIFSKQKISANGTLR